MVNAMRLTQEGKMLKALKIAGKDGIANYEFATTLRILSYTKIISNLRKEGHNIYSERLLLPNGRSSGVIKYYLG